MCQYGNLGSLWYAFKSMYSVCCIWKNVWYYCTGVNVQYYSLQSTHEQQWSTMPLLAYSWPCRLIIIIYTCTDWTSKMYIIILYTKLNLLVDSKQVTTIKICRIWHIKVYYFSQILMWITKSMHIKAMHSIWLSAFLFPCAASGPRCNKWDLQQRLVVLMTKEQLKNEIRAEMADVIVKNNQQWKSNGTI